MADPPGLRQPAQTCKGLDVDVVPAVDEARTRVVDVGPDSVSALPSSDAQGSSRSTCRQGLRSCSDLRSPSSNPEGDRYVRTRQLYYGLVTVPLR